MNTIDPHNPPYEIDIPDGRGGPGRNQGRRKVSDKKKQVYIMIEESKIKLLGGQDAVKQLLNEAVANKIASFEFESNTGETEKAG